jgi:citronellyl-CoA dehydrogenase
MQQFQEERLYAAAAGLVAKERMIQDTIEYTSQRRAFGQSISTTRLSTSAWPS